MFKTLRKIWDRCGTVFCCKFQNLNEYSFLFSLERVGATNLKCICRMGHKQWALAVGWKTAGNQHLGISMKSLKTWICLDDVEISVNLMKSEIILKDIGYCLDMFDTVGCILES